MSASMNPNRMGRPVQPHQRLQRLHTAGIVVCHRGIVPGIVLLDIDTSLGRLLQFRDHPVVLRRGDPSLGHEGAVGRDETE
ncbi:MAG: hypothetical protein ABEK12_03190, partial [Candidatus Nanohaloarchaea archaeon]